MDSQIRLPLLREIFNIGDDASCLDTFVWQIFQQVFFIVNADNTAVVVDTDIQGAALGVGEAANPFKVFVFPGLLVFHILRFHTLITTTGTIYCVA